MERLGLGNACDGDSQKDRLCIAPQRPRTQRGWNRVTQIPRSTFRIPRTKRKATRPCQRGTFYLVGNSIVTQWAL